MKWITRFFAEAIKLSLYVVMFNMLSNSNTTTSRKMQSHENIQTSLNSAIICMDRWIYIVISTYITFYTEGDVFTTAISRNLCIHNKALTTLFLLQWNWRYFCVHNFISINASYRSKIKIKSLSFRLEF